MTDRNPKVDGFVRKNSRWAKELEALRDLVLSGPLVEEVKWRVPCYTLDGKNVILLTVLKESCVLSFLKGALLKDERGLLAKPGENSQIARIVRFANVKEIETLAPVLKAYVGEAIEVEKAGLKVKVERDPDEIKPEELRKKLEEDAAFRRAFRALTPGRQRAYMIHFAGAKQPKTREARIEKCAGRILEGKGLDDDYRPKAMKR